MHFAKPVPNWSMPWVPPTAPLTQDVLAALERPLHAWIVDEFDVADYLSNFSPGEVTRTQREVGKLGTRPNWQIERIWYPTSEDGADVHDAYNKASRRIAGRLIAPACLDAFVIEAYEAAGISDDDPADYADIDPSDLTEALAWTEAGICVLQQSLPWPFTDVLLYGTLDNRPAHRLLYAHATLLSRRHPRKAVRWFRAMLYCNPPDNMGARFHLK